MKALNKTRVVPMFSGVFWNYGAEKHTKYSGRYRLRKKYLLSFLYLSRAVVITLSLMLPISDPAVEKTGNAI